LFLGTNHRPTIKGNDGGMWRRIRLIPFDETFEGERQDPNLKNTLLAELPGVLNWCLAGCTEWLDGGLKSPPEVMQATGAYRAEMDIFGAFLEDACTKTDRLEDTVQASVLYTEYKTWAQNNGEKPVSNTAFSRRLKEQHGLDTVRQSRGNFWVRLKLGFSEPGKGVTEDMPF